MNSANLLKLYVEAILSNLGFECIETGLDKCDLTVYTITHSVSNEKFAKMFEDMHQCNLSDFTFETITEYLKYFLVTYDLNRDEIGMILAEYRNNYLQSMVGNYINYYMSSKYVRSHQLMQLKSRYSNRGYISENRFIVNNFLETNLKFIKKYSAPKFIGNNGNYFTAYITNAIKEFITTYDFFEGTDMETDKVDYYDKVSILNGDPNSFLDISKIISDIREASTLLYGKTDNVLRYDLIRGKQQSKIISDIATLKKKLDKIDKKSFISFERYDRAIASNMAYHKDRVEINNVLVRSVYENFNKLNLRDITYVYNNLREITLREFDHLHGKNEGKLILDPKNCVLLEQNPRSDTFINAFKIIIKGIVSLEKLYTNCKEQKLDFNKINYTVLLDNKISRFSSVGDLIKYGSVDFKRVNYLNDMFNFPIDTTIDITDGDISLIKNTSKINADAILKKKIDLNEFKRTFISLDSFLPAKIENTYKEVELKGLHQSLLKKLEEKDKIIFSKTIKEKPYIQRLRSYCHDFFSDDKEKDVNEVIEIYLGYLVCLNIVYKSMGGSRLCDKISKDIDFSMIVNEISYSGIGKRLMALTIKTRSFEGVRNAFYELDKIAELYPIVPNNGVASYLTRCECISTYCSSYRRIFNILSLNKDIEILLNYSQIEKDIEILNTISKESFVKNFFCFCNDAEFIDTEFSFYLNEVAIYSTDLLEKLKSYIRKVKSEYTNGVQFDMFVECPVEMKMILKEINIVTKDIGQDDLIEKSLLRLSRMNPLNNIKEEFIILPEDISKNYVIGTYNLIKKINGYYWYSRGIDTLSVMYKDGCIYTANTKTGRVIVEESKKGYRILRGEINGLHGRRV